MFEFHKKAESWSLVNIVVIVFIITLFIILFYTTRIYNKSSHYESMNNIIINNNINNLLYGLTLSTIPGINYTYLELLILSAKQRIENPSVYQTKVYIGDGSKYILLDDLVLNIFNSYFNEGHWHIVIRLNNQSVDYGYKIPLYGTIYTKEIVLRDNTHNLINLGGVKPYTFISLKLSIW